MSFREKIRQLAQQLSRAILGGLLVLPAAASAQLDLEKLEADLAGPYSILLENGGRQTGKLVSFDEGSLRLEVELGGGSAEMNFSADQIARIRFPGNEYLSLLDDWAGDPDRVPELLTLYRALYKQRGPFIQYMEKRDLRLFVDYAQLAFENGEPLMAVSVINVLRPFIEDQALLRSLEDTRLLALFRAGRVEEAEAQAREWIASNDPAGASALGWAILAEFYFDQGAYENAFWTALYPVAYSGALPTEHLASCYALAISAARKNRQETVAERLYQEMLDRAMPWPEDLSALAELQPERPAPEPESPGGSAALQEVTPTAESIADEPTTNAESELEAEPAAEALEPMEEEITLPSRIQ